MPVGIAVAIASSCPRQARAEEGARAADLRPGRSVQITESRAVVYVLPCPEGTEPVWQPLVVHSMLALPELGWLGVGHARVCGVNVSGVETEMVLACQRADGTHHGPVGSWHEGGEKRTEGMCRSGAAHGAWRRFDRDGRKALEGHFDRGRRVGMWSVWDRQGRKRTVRAAEVIEGELRF
jgi:hypothetical protein